MLRLSLQTCARRCYSTSSPSSSSTPLVQLVAQIRKRTQTSVSKAREALAASGNDLDATLAWLERDRAQSSSAKQEKVADRDASEGLIGVSLLANGPMGARGAMMDLRCETDFVARNELFGQLAADVAHTAAFYAEQQESSSGSLLSLPNSVDSVLDAPLLSPRNPEVHDPSHSVRDAIRDTIGKVGENIQLRRVLAFAKDRDNSTQSAKSFPVGALRVASYTHGAPSYGTIGVLALLEFELSRRVTDVWTDAFEKDLGRLERAITRQIAGFDTNSIDGDRDDEFALYNQPFYMLIENDGDQSVRDGLQKWARERGVESVSVADFAKWSIR